MRALLLAAVGVVLLAVPLLLPQELPVEEGSVEAYFCQVEDCETVLLAALGNATDIACAFYDLELPSVIGTLRDKDADMVVHEENAIPGFPPVESAGLMHHKFCVLDGSIVVTGSMNPTENGVRKNDNNLIVIRSTRIADAYAREFRNLGGEKHARGTVVELSGTPVLVRFCPQEDCEGELVRALDSARHDIVFMTFTFTSEPVADALIRAKARGVHVEGVIEKRQMSRYSQHETLRSWDVPVYADGNGFTMHHKVFVIDNSTVVTGSYNPTWSASQRNDENILVIVDEGIAAAFTAEYGRVTRSAASAG